VKANIIKFLRGLVRKQAEPTPPVRQAPPPGPRPQVSAQVGPPTGARAGTSLGNPSYAAKTLAISLQKIIAGLPPELHPRGNATDTEYRLIHLPLEKVLPQLARGSVRLTFGDLRKLEPDVFGSASDRDAAWVELPLAEILKQVNPAMITRRRTQRRVEVPEEISSPFETANQLRQGGAAGRAPNPPAPMPPAVPAPDEAEENFPLPSGIRPGLVDRLRPPTTAIPPSAPVQHPRAGMNGNGNGKSNGKPINPPGLPVPAPELQPSPAPKSNPNPTPYRNGSAATPAGLSAEGIPPAPRFSLPPDPAPTPAAIPQAPSAPPAGGSPVAANAPSSSPARPRFDGAQSAEAPIVASLGQLSAAWAAPVRTEIIEFKLEDSQVHIPVEFLEAALKQGRVMSNWKTVRQWLHPQANLKISPADATAVELPLKVVAPLFLARQKERLRDRQKVEVDKDIPNLFFGFPEPDAAPPRPAPSTGDTNFYAWDDSTGEVKAQPRSNANGPGSPGTRFVSKYATPNEVVSRAAGLEGVAGALVALPDGLMVASCLSPDLNSETLAAFLPQIFGKVSQSTKELRMGELNNLNFTVGNVPWKIFRVNAIYFAAFGRAGQPLPTAQLAALAGELDHNK